MRVSEVQITPVKPSGGLVAFASFVLFDAIYCGSVAVFTRPDGTYRLSYPNKRVGERELDIFYPISRQAGIAIEQAVIAAYEDVMSKTNARYDNSQLSF